MQSFAELLTEYMVRTGISDSELARTLGVRRQTIFRWKEGLVEKPRYREDILKVAGRLLLTAEERDKLLLAAGFPPEAPPAQLLAPAIEETTSKPKLSSIRKLAWFALPLLAIVTAAIIVVIRMQSASPYPVAAEGESLILIAPLATYAAPGLPSRQVSPGTATPNMNDFSESLRAALEREIRAARFDGVRAAITPGKILDAAAADTARDRGNARLVIWGDIQGNSLAARFSLAAAASRTDDLPLDALVAPPADLPFNIDMDAPEQVQALALLALAQVYIDRGNLDQARGALARLPQSQPVWFAQMGYIDQLEKPPSLNQATQYYTRTIDLDPNAATAFLDRGVTYIRQNNPDLWQADLNRFLALRPDDALGEAALCWGYALDAQPDAALSHCDAAVRVDKTGRSLDVRAIVHAEAGRLAEAASDWLAFLQWLSQQPESLRRRYGSTRADWLQAVQAGRNPIDSATLDMLRRQ